MSQLQRAYGDRMNFIHVESYAYPFGESAQSSPPKLSAGMEEWGLFSEPWVFLIDGTGAISAKYEGGITLDELTSMMAGGAELESLAHELARDMGESSPVVADLKADLGADRETDGEAPGAESP